MTYEQMLSIINFNEQSPWDHDFYIYRGTEPMGEQEFCDFAHPKIEFAIAGSPFPFHRRFNDAYFYVPKGSTLKEGLLEFCEQITDIPTQPEE